ncbi:Phosphate-binding protein PstS precursor [Rosistilla carotiformis]|uniref:Phosphate-binding protein n=1 Tax=Rosistilla carotiformis TaxID=2528017 RepID=A0A518JUV6_9BACT|nr:phosphate ABC transporter substrate-binding protein PstS [Rosistilla carotiformis]QDV69331.1 Phosphate-binding protein PstS precursor [Rosistilla carotiformis]
MSVRIRLLLAIATLVPLFGCSKPTVEPVVGETLGIRGAGATFPAPLYKKWIEEYQTAFPDRHVAYAATGSGDGVHQFIAETVDFGGSDAGLLPDEEARVTRGAVTIPVTGGVLVLAYNLPNLTEPLKLSRRVYVDIFLGKIKRWNDPRIAAENPDLPLPKLDIVVVARQDSSGTTYAFTNHLSSISDDWKSDGPGTGKLIDWPGSTMLADGNGGVAGQIQRSHGSIGYVQYGIAAHAKLQMASLENRAGKFITPNGDSGMQTLENADLPENLQAFFPDPKGEDSYPIVTLTWLLLYEKYADAEKAEAVEHFVTWCLEAGQNYSDSLGYIPLSPSVLAASTKALRRVSNE